MATFGQLGTYLQTGSLFEGLATTGLVLSSGNVASVQEGGNPSTDCGGFGYKKLEAISRDHKATDAAVAFFSFTASQATTISLSYVFASEEYNSGYPDMFGLWVNNVNMAVIGGLPVSTASVNCGASGRAGPNCPQYIDNSAQWGTSLNGYTRTQTVLANLQAGKNTIEIAIADSYLANGATDATKDSAVFLSMTPTPVAPAPSPVSRPIAAPSPASSPLFVPSPVAPPLAAPSPISRPSAAPTPALRPVAAPSAVSSPLAAPSPISPPASTPSLVSRP
jgi:hypothetical protein